MDANEAFAMIKKALFVALKKEVSVTEDTELLKEEMLDSLDGLVFLMELEQLTGIDVPEDADLAEEGYYKISKLIKLILEKYEVA